MLAILLLGIVGKLVGIPTFGAVISTGRHTLIDGSYVRMPGRGWYVKSTGKNMEHGPAVPDIIIDNPPDARAKGIDPQLKQAVDELMKELPKLPEKPKITEAPKSQDQSGEDTEQKESGDE